MYSMTPEQLEALKIFSKLSYDDMVKEFNELHDQFNELVDESTVKSQ